MLVQNVPPVGVDWPPPVDEKPNRLCRVVAHRKLAPKQSVFSSKDSYYEIDATPNDDALPQRTYIVDNVYLSAYPDEASERAMVEKLYPIGEPELCTPEFGQKQ